MQKLNCKVTLVLFALVATVPLPGKCNEFVAMFDSDGQRVCAVGQPSEVHLLTNTMTLECVRLCDENPHCLVLNLYDNTTCEIFTCSPSLYRGYRNVESCKSFRINDCTARRNQPECGILPKDCADVRATGCVESGAYIVYPGGSNIAANVYCEVHSPLETWLVFQRREDGSENFERPWTDYAKGFGDANGEFWLGNENLYLLTSSKQYKLRIKLEDFEGQIRYAEYASFSIGSSSTLYRLSVSGNAGDAGDSMTYHDGYQFSTVDADHDADTSVNCAQFHRGAWWYNKCHVSNLNGCYLRGSHTTLGDGVNWDTFRGLYYSLKKTEMKITPVN